jgi:hypothetical protein
VRPDQSGDEVPLRLTPTALDPFYRWHAHSLAGFFRTCAALPLVYLTQLVENEVMFSVHCPRHGGEVLLTERHIVSLDSAGDHLTVRWICWCGHRGSHRTGRARRRPVTSVV